MSNSLETTVTRDSITVVTSDGEVHILIRGQENFDAVRDAVAEDMISDEPTLTEDRFYALLHYKTENPLTRLTGRVTYDEDRDILLFDGDPIHTTLAEYIRELVKSKNPQVGAFVNFMVRLSGNPSEKSRNSLFDWIQTLLNKGEKLTITPEGMLVAYKGVLIDEDGDPASINVGPGFVDGVYVENAHLKNKVGSTVSVSRSYVDANTARGCSRGLHAGTYSYAHNFARGMTLRVEIDPVDVVAVPADCAYQKIRTCRYTVIEVNDEPETLPVVRGTSAGWSPEDFEAWEDEGLDYEDADIYNARGYSVEEAFELEENGGIAALDAEDEEPEAGSTMQDWLNLGYTVPQVLRLQKNGVSFESAQDEDYDLSILRGPVQSDESDDDDEDEDERCEDCGFTLESDEDEVCQECEDSRQWSGSDAESVVDPDEDSSAEDEGLDRARALREASRRSRGW